MLHNPLLRRIVFIMDGTTEYKVTGKYREFFIFIYHFTTCPTSPGIFFTMAKFSIAPVEVFIKCYCIFVAFLLGATTTTSMIACTMSTEVELSPNGTLLPLPVLDWFQMTLYKRVIVNFTKWKKKSTHFAVNVPPSILFFCPLQPSPIQKFSGIYN